MPATDRQPVLFIGHGSPMNAIEDNRWSRAFRALAQELEKPRAVLAISAHWFVPGSFVTAQRAPQTLHDFGGFPPALHDVSYPAPGDPQLASEIVALGEGRIHATTEWGLDHGSWSVLRHLFPAADVPVLQLSMDTRCTPTEHFTIARALAPLRERDVLILASGNIVHNLAHAFRAMHRGDTDTPDWAARFDADIAMALQTGNGDFVVRALDSTDGRSAHPTPEHYLPLLYAMAATYPGETVDFPVEGFDMGSLSMRSVRWQSRHA